MVEKVSAGAIVGARAWLPDIPLLSSPLEPSRTFTSPGGQDLDMVITRPHGHSVIARAVSTLGDGGPPLAECPEDVVLA